MSAPSSASELGRCWGRGPGVDSCPMETKPGKAHEVYSCNGHAPCDLSRFSWLLYTFSPNCWSRVSSVGSPRDTDGKNSSTHWRCHHRL